MKIHRLNIIHLENSFEFPHREVRERSFLKQIEEQGITDYKVWPGIFEPRDPKKGICMSHKQIIRDAKENNLPCCLIMEDDCIFSAPGAFDYFLSQVPEDYDLFMGLIYHGEIRENRVINGFSGGMTLYLIHERFYDTALNNVADSSHIDRSFGEICFKHEYYVCNPFVVKQLGGYSENLKRSMSYQSYHENMEFF